MARKRHATDYVQLNVRMKETMRRQIETAANRNGQTMNAEVLKRLERSFEPEVLHFTEIMGAAFKRGGEAGAAACEHPEWPEAKWIKNSLCYAAAVSAVVDALDAARPRLEFAPHLTPEQRKKGEEMLSEAAARLQRAAKKGAE